MSLEIAEIAELALVVPPVTVSPLVKALVGTMMVNWLVLSSLLFTFAVAPLVAPVIVSSTAKLFAEPTVNVIVLSAKLVGL